MNKIFGIGLSRTGTSSLYEALRVLGINACHYPTNYNDMQHYQACVDASVTFGYKFLDAMFPNSKFIYTVREPTKWVESIKKYFEVNVNPIASVNDFKVNDFTDKVNMILYKTTHFNSKDHFLKMYHEHDTDVRGWFKDRPNDLLILDICNGCGWNELCQFLNTPTPQQQFPKTNSSDEAWKTLQQLF